MTQIGRILVASGAALMVLGGIFLLAQKFPWIGKLPGDIYIRKEGFSFYFPVTTCILVSVVISIILMLLKKR